MEHLSRTDIEAIVMGTASADDRARRHLRDCPDCAAQLAREARLEEALHESMAGAGRGDAQVARPAALHVLWPAAAALAIVAAGAWFVGSRPSGAAPTRPAVGAPATSAAAPRVWSIDAPGLMDPLSSTPGYAVTSPAEYCLRPAARLEIGPHR